MRLLCGSRAVSGARAASSSSVKAKLYRKLAASLADASPPSLNVTVTGLPSSTGPLFTITAVGATF